jgi:hypothetical protein
MGAFLGTDRRRHHQIHILGLDTLRWKAAAEPRDFMRTICDDQQYHPHFLNRAETHSINNEGASVDFTMSSKASSAM